MASTLESAGRHEMIRDSNSGGMMPFGYDYGDIAHSLASIEEIIAEMRS
jgi:hypothetical protein